MGYNGGPHFSFSEGFSLFVACEDQREVDEYWDKLLRAGATPKQGGWITDQFGLSWRIIPNRFLDLVGEDDEGNGWYRRCRGSNGALATACQIPRRKHLRWNERRRRTSRRNCWICFTSTFTATLVVGSSWTVRGNSPLVASRRRHSSRCSSPTTPARSRSRKTTNASKPSPRRCCRWMA